MKLVEEIKNAKQKCFKKSFISEVAINIVEKGESGA